MVQSSSPFLACSYAAVCSGCDLLHVSFDEQKEQKLSALHSALTKSIPAVGIPKPEWISIANGGLRDRVDLMVDRRSGSYRVGLFDRFRTGLVDLQGCPQLSPSLESWLRDFRQIEIPVERGSIRLRVAPDGTRGVWLDLANIDVKNLLEERTTLDRLREMAIVEIGQKRKRLVEKEGQLKLHDPVLEPWFETYVDGKPVPLYCTVGSFTQPGFQANRALIHKTMDYVSRSSARSAAEFGSGIGNFTIPLANVVDTVDAFEVDNLALDGLSLALAEQSLLDKVRIHSGNFQGPKAESLGFEGVDLMLVDPPRSGLMQFLNPLEKMDDGAKPKAFVYVSCFVESFAADSERLMKMGYEMAELAVVDQFPQSKHFETVALFER